MGDALNIPIGILFEEPDSKEEEKEFSVSKSPVVHENERKILSLGKGIKFYLLNPHMNGEIKTILNILEPGATTARELYVHQGEECGLVLEGELEVQLEDKEYLLKKGDSITFKSMTPHRKTNTGKTKSISVWANTAVPF